MRLQILAFSGGYIASLDMGELVMFSSDQELKRYLRRCEFLGEEILGIVSGLRLKRRRCFLALPLKPLKRPKR